MSTAAAQSSERVRRLRRPLSPATFWFRNLGKALPLIGVISLAVMLICGIVSMMNSIPLSIRTIYSYSKNFVAITPRGDPTMPPQIVAKAMAESPVPIDRVMFCRATGTEVRSIVGNWPFANLGLTPSDADYYMQAMGAKLLEGRMPKDGAPEVVLSEPIARNLNKKIGDTLQGPEDQDNYSPQEVKIVGIADSKLWLMVGNYAYQRDNHYPPVDGVLLFAKNESDQLELDEWALAAFKGQRAQVLAFSQLNKDTEEMFRTLYRILNVVIGTLVLVITIMMGMLMNIYQSQRLVEFGLLQALGYTKRQLLTRVQWETVLVVIVGWCIGIALSYGLLLLVEKTLMYPNAYALETFDKKAFTYTIPTPIAILLVASLTVMLRFRKFDPVGVVERRLV